MNAFHLRLVRFSSRNFFPTNRDGEIDSPMKQILQSYETGELWLAEVPIPACKSGGVVIQTLNSFVSAGTERMLVDFAKKNSSEKPWPCRTR